MVLAGSKGGGDALVQEELSGHLERDGDAQGRGCQPEGVAGDVDISSREDEGDDRDKGNTRGTWREISHQEQFIFRGQKLALTRVVPRQELVEEGVVVRQGLAVGSRSLGGLARGSEVGEFRRGLGSMVLDILRNGSCKRDTWLKMVHGWGERGHSGSPSVTELKAAVTSSVTGSVFWSARNTADDHSGRLQRGTQNCDSHVSKVLSTARREVV